MRLPHRLLPIWRESLVALAAEQAILSFARLIFRLAGACALAAAGDNGNGHGSFDLGQRDRAVRLSGIARVLDRLRLGVRWLRKPAHLRALERDPVVQHHWDLSRCAERGGYDDLDMAEGAVMRQTVRRQRSERGSTMLEFALTFVIFLMFVLGGFEMGRAIWTYATLSHAAKQAVRYAMIHGADNTGADENGNALGQSDVDTLVEAVARDNAVGLDAQLVQVETTWTPNNAPGSTVEARVTYPFQYLFAAVTSTNGGMALATEYSMIVTN